MQKIIPTKIIFLAIYGRTIRKGRQIYLNLAFGALGHLFFRNHLTWQRSCKGCKSLQNTAGKAPEGLL